ncbi:MAG: M48 family metalloprotease, partial [Alphaproteobacteria bacterium]
MKPERGGRKTGRLIPALLAALMLAFSGGPAQALNFVRDGELENTIRAFLQPVFDAAGLSPGQVRIFIINDPSLNAFVAGGQNLFINTGLFLNTTDPGAVIGVLAHEVGHITGGHLLRLDAELDKARAQTIAAMVLGVVAGVATGDTAATGVISSTGGGIAMANVASFSRGQEAAADAAALRYLDQAGLPADGLLDVLDTLDEQSILVGRGQPDYLRTHPLTRDRIDGVRRPGAATPAADRSMPQRLIDLHGLARAKLFGFTRSAGETLRAYPESDLSVPARYARAIAWGRQADLARALPLFDELIAAAPDNPWFRETRGQILFEAGQNAAALDDYKAAVSLAPDEPLLLSGLGRVQVESGQPDELVAAVGHLEKSLSRDPDQVGSWRDLGIAYGRT